VLCLDQALAPEPFVVYEMNGQPLPPQHGFRLA
jgi:DMSO/TMAO reductase YedYZ molybdopterin-dependent catalytic subunit